PRRHLAAAGFSFGSGLEHDGGAAKPESLANLVDQVALVREVERAAPAGKYNEFRRANGRLGDVKDLPLFEVKMLHEAVHLSGGNSLGCRVVYLVDEFEQRFHAGARLGRQEDHGSIVQKLELIA